MGGERVRLQRQPWHSTSPNILDNVVRSSPTTNLTKGGRRPCKLSITSCLVNLIISSIAKHDMGGVKAFFPHHSGCQLYTSTTIELATNTSRSLPSYNTSTLSTNRHGEHIGNFSSSTGAAEMPIGRVVSMELRYNLL